MSLHPFGDRAVVVDPPAENQMPSGIILPAGLDDCAVGIVQEMSGPEALSAGTVVYYHKGHCVQIGDCRVIDATCIIAWEPA